MPRYLRRPVTIVACLLVALSITPVGRAAEAAGVSAGDRPEALPATADTYVDADRPRTSFGSRKQLRLSGAPVRRGYVRFSLPDTGSGLRRARLSVFVTAGSSAGFVVRGVSRVRWSERRLAFAGAQPVAAGPSVRSGAVRAGAWTTIDVTPLVSRRNGRLALALVARAEDLALESRESARGPRLALEFGRKDSPAPAVPTPEPVIGAASRFGLASGGTIEWAGEADLARELAGYREVGAGWMRFDVKWSVVEASRGSFDWTRYDRVIGAATAGGLRVVANLAYTPEWARPAGATDDKFAPTDPADYARFARAAVARYAPLGVKHYEIWNEPNITAFWKPVPDPARYTDLLKLAYSRMKQADPTITVLAGSFSPAGGYHDPGCGGPSRNVNAIDFLERMYAGGAAGSFDALAHHPYGGSEGPSGTHRCNAWNQMAGTSPSLRSVMVANGDAGKTIWATEFGSEADKLGEQGQAAQIADAMRRWRTYPWAGRLMVYSYRQSLEGFNLVRMDWSPRPAWYAFQAAARA